MKWTVFCAAFFMSTMLLQAQHDGNDDGMGHGHHMCHDDAVKTRILSVADFNGNGKVGQGDVAKLKRAIRHREYHAIMDLNADETLDWQDLKIATDELGQLSTPFDRQLIRVWRATRRYARLETAIEEGFRPFTQELAGHGRHYTRLPVKFETDADGNVITSGPPFYLGTFDEYWENKLDEDVEITVPEGLNYDQNGDLVAVFYYQGIDIADWVKTNRTAYLCGAGAITDPAVCGAAVPHAQYLALASLGSVGLVLNPETKQPMDMGPPHLNFFDDTNDSEMWHQHLGACWDYFSYETMQQDPSHTPLFTQAVTPSECNEFITTPQRGYIPGFNMMHLWLYKLNRCGLFAGTDQEVSPHAPEEPHEYDRTRMEFFMEFLTD